MVLVGKCCSIVSVCEMSSIQLLLYSYSNVKVLGGMHVFTFSASVELVL